MDCFSHSIGWDGGSCSRWLCYLQIQATGTISSVPSLHAFAYKLLFYICLKCTELVSSFCGGWQSYMDSEIRAIMAQYMPLDSQNEVHTHMQEDA